MIDTKDHLNGQSTRVERSVIDLSERSGHTGTAQKIPIPAFADTATIFRIEPSHFIESAVFHIYHNTADSRTRLNFENCGRICECYTADGIFFLSK